MQHFFCDLKEEAVAVVVVVEEEEEEEEEEEGEDPFDHQPMFV
jgi:hypothetical protein